MSLGSNDELKLTPQRLAILKYLDNNKEHPSAADIHKAMSRNFPTMSLATVYNTLKVLKRLKNIQELSIDSDKRRFDPDTGDHNHLICIKCKKIVDVKHEFRLDIPDAEKQEFEIIGNHVDFYGVCPECRNRKKT